MAEIKEINLSLNTMSSGKATLKTKKINGELLALILKTNELVHVTIMICDTDIVIFDKVDFRGEYYMPLNITPLSKSANAFNFSANKWYLNDCLEVSIKGSIGTMVEGKIRYR